MPAAALAAVVLAPVLDINVARCPFLGTSRWPDCLDRGCAHGDIALASTESLIALAGQRFAGTDEVVNPIDMINV